MSVCVIRQYFSDAQYEDKKILQLVNCSTKMSALVVYVLVALTSCGALGELTSLSNKLHFHNTLRCTTFTVYVSFFLSLSIV